MSDHPLQGRRILVVEDEFMLAEEMRETLEAEGAEVVGPVAKLSDGLAILQTRSDIDGAVLDINLQGEMVFPLADKLSEMSIPFLFATGYEADAVPERFSSIIRCEKPVQAQKLRHAIGRTMAS